MRAHLFFLLFCSLFLVGCPRSANKTQKEIEKNELNLPNPKFVNHLGIRFVLSEIFKQNTSFEFTLKQTDAVSFIAESVSIHFSIEKYSPSELASIQFKNGSENQSDLDALRDYFAKQRFLSIENAIVSEPIELASKTGKKGWLQSVIEEKWDKEYDLHYAIATIEYKKNYYVFQFIAGKKNMPYLLDDFMNIIQSIM